MSKRGVFWLIEGTIFAVQYNNPKSGIGIAKSGSNYNHRLLWDHVKPQKFDKAYDYYPRGRVETDNKGRTVIYLSMSIDESFIPVIIETFKIDDVPRIHYDGSEHYKSIYDTE